MSGNTAVRRGPRAPAGCRGARRRARGGRDASCCATGNASGHVRPGGGGSGIQQDDPYKWWPSPGALAAEAYFAHSRQTLDFPNTGDIRADLITQLRSFVRWLKEEGAEKAVSELIGAAQLDPSVALAWSQSYALPRRELARQRLQIAQQQGQLREDADLHIIVDQLWGACYHRLLVLRVPFDDSIVERLVDQALYGAAPHDANRPEPSRANRRTNRPAA